MLVQIKQPKEAVGAIDGLYYKFGANDKPFYWNGYSWIASAKNPNRLRAAIEKKKNPFAMGDIEMKMS